MEFSRQEYWSGLPCPPSGDLPDPGVQPEFLLSSALAGGFFTTCTTWETWEAPWSHLRPHSSPGRRGWGQVEAPWSHLRPHSSPGRRGWGAGAGEVGSNGGVCGVGACLRPLDLLFLPAGHMEHPQAPLSHCRKLYCESSKA